MLTFRDDDSKRTPHVWIAINGDIPVVNPGNSPGKAKAQPGARLRSAGITAIKAFKNVGKIFF